MKKYLLTMVTMLVLGAGGNALLSQWAQYNADALPEADATVNMDAGANLVSGTSVIMVDPEDATNNLWKYNVELPPDEIKYSWYPSYWDQNSLENTPVPAPMTIACKFKWIDTANTDFGPDLELREVNKVQAKVIKEGGGKFSIRVKDWAADSSFMLPAEFDPTVWHVLRLISNGADWSVHLDEDPIAFASGVQGKSTGKHLALFGAYAENGKSGIIIDWMGLIEDAASSPTDMPLPAGIFDSGSGTSVEDQKASVLLSIYPNPVSDMLTVSIENGLVNSGYELVNITGKVVKSGLFNKQVNKLDVSGLNPGMYFVKINSGIKVISESFIVK